MEPANITSLSLSDCIVPYSICATCTRPQVSRRPSTGSTSNACSSTTIRTSRRQVRSSTTTLSTTAQLDLRTDRFGCRPRLVDNGPDNQSLLGEVLSPTSLYRCYLL